MLDGGVGKLTCNMADDLMGSCCMDEMSQGRPSIVGAKAQATANDRYRRSRFLVVLRHAQAFRDLLTGRAIADKDLWAISRCEQETELHRAEQTQKRSSWMQGAEGPLKRP